MRRPSPRKSGPSTPLTAVLLLGFPAAGCSSDDSSSSDEATTGQTASSGPVSTGPSSDTSGGDLFCDPNPEESIQGDATVLLEGGQSVLGPFISGNAYNDPDLGPQIVLSTVELAPCSGLQASPSVVGEYRVFAGIEVIDGQAQLGLSYAIYDGSSTAGVGQTVLDATISFDCPLSLDALTEDIPIGTTISGSLEGQSSDISASAEFTLTFCGDEVEPDDRPTTDGSSSTGDYGSSTGDFGSSTGDYGSSTGDYGSSTGDYGSSTGG